MADDVQESEGTIIININGQLIMAPPGSESLACKQSYFMNVGDPIVSPGMEYYIPSLISEGCKKNNRESEGS